MQNSSLCHLFGWWLNSTGLCMACAALYMYVQSLGHWVAPVALCVCPVQASVLALYYVRTACCSTVFALCRPLHYAISLHSVFICVSPV